MSSEWIEPAQHISNRKQRNAMIRNDLEIFHNRYKGLRQAVDRLDMLKMMAGREYTKIRDTSKSRDEFEKVKRFHRLKLCLCCYHENASQRHHIVPICHGGNNGKANIIPVCDTCHAIIHPWLAGWKARRVCVQQLITDQRYDRDNVKPKRKRRWWQTRKVKTWKWGTIDGKPL